MTPQEHKIVGTGHKLRASSIEHELDRLAQEGWHVQAPIMAHGTTTGWLLVRDLVPAGPLPR
jgi:hypothetical protein